MAPPRKTLNYAEVRAARGAYEGPEPFGEHQTAYHDGGTWHIRDTLYGGSIRASSEERERLDAIYAHTQETP